MSEVIVLFEGYSTQIDDVTMDANCSCVLIKTAEKHNIIVDTMTAWDKQDIIDALAKHNLSPDDIKYVICSHSHADHIGNNNLFLKAEEHIVGCTVHHNTLFHERNIKTSVYNITKGVKVISTPGHTAEDVTVLVDGKFNGDLFEKEEDVNKPSIWMNFGMPELREHQATSRYMIADFADVIIPGHGSFFHVTNEIKKKLMNQLEMIKCGILTA
ncbi:metallo-beta-lactamase domain-containing protein 1-like isoform X2 [Phymastichus coffea]|uniref:metallo-beta-lactamase domain-containing protein 1-like isoform X2 n=1 Tax=Phymastichus coffea TaxID=108790 RepID=UPI00273CA852|nr:metallo-beta-lactamase domain-containing protein 1-like isoform X2 [Phymastichus coffea]XP_058802538.1 metallo-beta-lactamase domain-containing protein 1-like isoform X2 [Phymastichus coffea]